MILSLYTLCCLLPLAFAGQGIGQPCTGDGDCDSGFCDDSSPSNLLCGPVPKLDARKCTPGDGFSECESHYCDPGTSLCARIPLGQPCYAQSEDDYRCSGPAICDYKRNGGDLVCLQNFVGVGGQCDVSRQCEMGNSCNKDGVCNAIVDPKGDGEPCEKDGDCFSGICEDHIANDGFQKVCLAANVPEFSGCDVSRQCTSGFCSPQNAPNEWTPLACRPESDRAAVEAAINGGGGSSSPSNNPGGNPNEEVVTTTVIQNGQPQTVVQTRTVGSGSGGAASARASASASRSSTSSSARASSAADPKLDGAGLLGLLASVVLGAFAL